MRSADNDTFRSLVYSFGIFNILRCYSFFNFVAFTGYFRLQCLVNTIIISSGISICHAHITNAFHSSVLTPHANWSFRLLGYFCLDIKSKTDFENSREAVRQSIAHDLRSFLGPFQAGFLRPNTILKKKNPFIKIRIILFPHTTLQNGRNIKVIYPATGLSYAVMPVFQRPWIKLSLE